MQLQNISLIEADMEVVTGLRIGAGDGEMHIGGVDNPVIRNPVNQQPYIPGSSLKGKIRSLLEWKSGQVQPNALTWKDYEKSKSEEVLQILQLFGVSGDANLPEADQKKLGPTRLSFWDCPLDQEWVTRLVNDNLSLVEVKSENAINRISGVAQNPRQTERVPPGASFKFKLSFKKLDGDDDTLRTTVLAGLKLLELDSLGGYGSRGYGKVRFRNLKIDGVDKSEEFEAVRPFEQ
ncbi:MAG: type III-A CRISPR-associated RAMP protein Csm3 [Methylobacteriaceae bacterium]|jgi:CRISPR-associated protein Csm3|nr:type III-A CRISPR-associated RAMP protein Csm3 [Methylobacteriaceae bacterium]